MNIFHENRLPADNSHEIACLICYFGKSGKNSKCLLLQIIGGALWVKKLCMNLMKLNIVETIRFLFFLCLMLFLSEFTFSFSN